MSELVYLNDGRAFTLPPLVTTVDHLRRPAPTPVASAICGTLVVRAGVDVLCGGLLTYEHGVWAHVDACLTCYDTPGACPSVFDHTDCPDPDPQQCDHGTCRGLVTLDVPCVTDSQQPQCCGCCWEIADELAARSPWI